jgi:hypothetical protein
MVVYALLLSLASIILAEAYTPFRVASIFGEHAVLQRAPASSRVWGWTTPQGVVEARLNCSASGGPVFATNVTADSDGLWVVTYPPINATHVPCYSSFTDVTSLNSVWYLDIVFGELLLCLGQVRSAAVFSPPLLHLLAQPALTPRFPTPLTNIRVIWISHSPT